MIIINKTNKREQKIKEVRAKLTENQELHSNGKLDYKTFESLEQKLLLKLENLFMSQNLEEILM